MAFLKRKPNNTAKALQAFDPSNAEGELRPSSMNHYESSFNNYKTWEEQIKAIEAKHRNEADYGCRMVKTILSYRRTWIMSELILTSEGAQEQGWLDDFTQFNDLRGSNAGRWALLGEKQGHVIFMLQPVRTISGEIKIKPVPLKWIEYKYKVRTKGGQVTEVSFDIDGREIVLGPDRFVAVILSEDQSLTSDNVLTTPPAIASCLTSIDDIDIATRDRRRINKLFASPTPVFSAKSARVVEGLISWLTGKMKKTGWRIGQYIAMPEDGSLTFAQASTEGSEALTKEIVHNTQNVSGAMGIPIFLFHPELIGGGRATATEFAEGTNVAIKYERTAWEKGGEELGKKSMILYNQFNGLALDPSRVEANIPEVALAQIERMFTMYNELRKQGDISRETLWERTPGINLQQESQRMAGEKENEVQSVTDKMNMLLTAQGEVNV